jgi:8-oxo-dGTP pyrophosphatase MutT (NUDIX family)
MRKRQAARVLLFDPGDSILLILFVIPRPSGDFIFWATPGGEIEPGESPLEAIRREIHEELGIAPAIDGPLWTDANQFLHQGDMVDNTDFYFVAHCPREAPKLLGLTPDELAIMKEIRWWTLDELNRTPEKVFPVDLVSRIRQLVSRAVASETVVKAGTLDPGEP